MGLSHSELQKIFAEAFQHIGHRRTPPHIEIGFYPFASLNSYIQVKDGKATVKLSDLLDNAPRSVHRALADILVAKLFNKPPNPQSELVYQTYTTSPPIRRAIERIHRQRGHKQFVGPRGRVRDLEKTFHKLNKQYFGGSLKMPRLTWSARRSVRILGYLDRIHRTLVISRLLDDARIPEFFYEYIMFHEMLHLKHAPRYKGNRCYNHTPEFQQDERRFRYYEQAQQWVERIASRRCRRPTNKREHGSSKSS
ncbi:MAG: M48 family peptidase [Acidobacteriota bacterium]|nr:M48 family peptidase [Acidobacteriota bacterium]